MTTTSAFFTGVLYGIIAPVVVLLIFDVWHKDWVLPDRPAIPYLIAIAVNMVILRFAIRKGKEARGYGLITITFVFTILVFILKLKH